MEKIRFVFVVFVLILSVFASLIVSYPVDVPSTKSYVSDNKNLQNIEEEGNSVFIRTFDDPETKESESESESKSNLGLRLFPDFSALNSKSPLDSSRVTQSNGTDDGTDDDGGSAEDYTEDDEGSPHKKADEPDTDEEIDWKQRIGGRIPPTIPTERTISIPKYKTDYLGNWVYNPYEVTYGQYFRDTRFNRKHMNIGFDDHTNLYNPYHKDLRTKAVCNRQSTAYNSPAAKKYLKKPFYSKYLTVGSYNIQMDLRREMYDKGKSEECHTPEQLNWRLFNECQMMRHMRMEYLVPYYPKFQTVPTSDFSYDTGKISMYHFPMEGV